MSKPPKKRKPITDKERVDHLIMFGTIELMVTTRDGDIFSGAWVKVSTRGDIDAAIRAQRKP